MKSDRMSTGRDNVSDGYQTLSYGTVIDERIEEARAEIELRVGNLETAVSEQRMWLRRILGLVPLTFINFLLWLGPDALALAGLVVVVGILSAGLWTVVLRRV